MIAMGASYALLAVLLAQAAGPHGDAEDKARAKALLQEGLTFNRKGQHAQALAKFEAAYAAYPSPKLWFNIGQVQVALDHPLEAVQAFEKFLALVPDARSEDRKDARSALAELGKKLGRLQIRCETTGAEVVLDGKSVGRVPLPEPLWAMPGSHRVTISHEGSVPATETVEISAGIAALVVIRLAPVSPVAAPSAPSAAKPGSVAPVVEMAIARGEATRAATQPAKETPSPAVGPPSTVDHKAGDRLPATDPTTPPSGGLATPAPPSATPPALELSTQPVPAAEASSARPFYRTWWFWTCTTVVLGGSVTAAILLARGGGSNVPQTELGNHGVFP
jgi:hypothetical protein